MASKQPSRQRRELVAVGLLQHLEESFSALYLINVIVIAADDENKDDIMCTF
jgi:hypothetical protein